MKRGFFTGGGVFDDSSCLLPICLGGRKNWQSAMHWTGGPSAIIAASAGKLPNREVGGIFLRPRREGMTFHLMITARSFSLAGKQGFTKRSLMSQGGGKLNIRNEQFSRAAGKSKLVKRKKRNHL